MGDDDDTEKWRDRGIYSEIGDMGVWDDIRTASCPSIPRIFNTSHTAHPIKT
jgi:hypothetical protein